MHRFFKHFLLLVASCSLPSAFAETPAAPDAGAIEQEAGRTLPPGAELAALEHFLSLPPERLASIRQLIERVESMSPEEREALQAKIAEYRQLHPRQRERMAQEFNEVPWQERGLIRAWWQQLTPDEAEAERLKMRGMSRDERQAYRGEILSKAKELGLQPAPPPWEPENRPMRPGGRPE